METPGPDFVPKATRVLYSSRQLFQTPTTTSSPFIALSGDELESSRFTFDFVYIMKTVAGLSLSLHRPRARGPGVGRCAMGGLMRAPLAGACACRNAFWKLASGELNKREMEACPVCVARRIIPQQQNWKWKVQAPSCTLADGTRGSNEDVLAPSTGLNEG